MKVLGRWRVRQTMLLLCGCVAVLVGVALAKTGQLIDISWVVLAGGLALVSLRRRNAWTLLLVVLFGLSLGWWRGSVYMQELANYQTLSQQKITIVAHVTGDAVYGQNSQMTFDVDNVVVASSGQRLTGKIGLSGFGLPAVFEGDTVEATGKLYPSRGSYQAKMSYATLALVKREPSIIGGIRRHFAAGMQTVLPEPLASFGLGLLIGQRNTLPAEVSQMLLVVGLTHIIAVSGYNLTILLRAAKRLLGERSRRQTLLLSLVLIATFLLLAGSSASIVRAALVSVLSVLATYYGRSIQPLVLIVLAAAITGFASPFYIWSDAGWYLSFLAFFGVMVLAPLLQVRLPARIQSSLVASVALESLCAEVMTLPYVLYTFGQMSLIGLVANVLVTALVPLAMLLSMIAGLAGMLIPAVAGWFAWPARLLLTYMLDVANLLSRVPHSFLQGIALPLGELIILYIAIALVCVTLWRKTKQLISATVTDE